MENSLSKRIVVTGGGSGGHTIPALVMIKYWRKKSRHEIFYLGSANGIEKQVVSNDVNQYISINTGKLRRYLSRENFFDFFRFLHGILQSLVHLYKIRPHVVFSTGGFVALPVVIAAKILRQRVVIHEQTTHVGLANKLSGLFADAICISFPTSVQYFPKERTYFTGYPLREEFYSLPKKMLGFKEKMFSSEKKTLLILGGGNGSVLLNNFVKNHYKILCHEFNVILQTGKVFESEFQDLKYANLWTFSFLQEEMIQLLNTADYVIARAGAGTVCELMHLKKLSIFVPLSIAQKNEQWHNAQAASKMIGSLVFTEEEWKNKKIQEIISLLKDLSAKEIHQEIMEDKNPTQKIDEIVFSNT